jgi:hypothetical protein
VAEIHDQPRAFQAWRHGGMAAGTSITIVGKSAT